MAQPIINKTVLVSGGKFFAVRELNPYANARSRPNSTLVAHELSSIKKALEQAGIHLATVAAPTDCPDGVFTANWGLCRGNKVILSSLPPQRQAEEAWAEKYLLGLGKEVIKPPYHFSGQGDALPCGNLLFAGSGYRTDARMHQFIADTLGYEVVSLHTEPERDKQGRPVINKVTRWPDSFFYDIDLALSVIAPNLIAWCPAAFTPESQEIIAALPVEKIEVSLDEAMRHFACNLVSTGETVIMGEAATELRSKLEAKGLKIITLSVTELAKGGGFIRCTTLTLDNE